MWHERCSLIRRITTADVVLLPEPVGPPTITRPWMARDQLSTTGGMPRPSGDGASLITRKISATEPRWRKTEARKRASCV
jgi:hypothetical protein